MFSNDQYRLIDFGGGQKLEQFGNRTVKRRTPSVDGFDSKTPTGQWEAAMEWQSPERQENWTSDESTKGDSSQQAEPWSITHDTLSFQLRATPSGQVGVFPEQSINWDWIQSKSDSLRGLNAINLFGYTGGTTMALAKCGAKVTHVDAVKNVVKWAKENAQSSGLQDAAVRWIAEDSMTFISREIKRKNVYDIFVADPPSFGRGPKGEVWKLERHLPELLQAAKELCGGTPKLFLLSCHTPGFDLARLSQLVGQVFRAGDFPGRLQRKPSKVALTLQADDGRTLPSGNCIRWAT